MKHNKKGFTPYQRATTPASGMMAERKGAFHRTRGTGFTLVELLVVIAIIGLLATIAFLSLNSARGKARDARRVSDIRQMQSALELYYNDQAVPSYPPLTITGAPATIENTLTASDATNLTVPAIPVRYVATVPTAPAPADNPPTTEEQCANSVAADTDRSSENTALTYNAYRYFSSTDTAGATACNGTATCAWYQYRFCLGGGTGGLGAGQRTATPSGIN